MCLLFYRGKFGNIEGITEYLDSKLMRSSTLANA